MRILSKILIVILVIFIVAQFFQPKKNDGDMASLQPFLNYTSPPENVKAILSESCFDCHSNHTTYPWYGSITPINFWMADHVKDGKKHFNMSGWEQYSLKQKDHKLEELIEMVENKEMPLPSYTYTHWDAKLSQNQIDDVVTWANRIRIKLDLSSNPK